MIDPPLQQLVVALALGLLVGLERERTEPSVAGVRTFPLITIFGTVCALLSEKFGGWILAAGLLGLAALVVMANLAKLKSGSIDPGLTTEMATVLLYAAGALVVLHMVAAVLVGGVVVLLLHLKKPLHHFVTGMGKGDLKAIMQFVLVSTVILPVLPDKYYGPYEALNPFKIWLVVVLIVGISLCGYVAFKLLGARKGILVGGVLGGLISSTATTVSFARDSRRAPDVATLSATVILVASTVVFARMLVLIAAVAAPVFAQLAPPIAVMLGAMAVLSIAFHLLSRRVPAHSPDPKNPAQLKSAVIFGAIYALVLLGTAFARDRFGNTGIYAVSLLSGLTDMDAITLSVSQLVKSGEVDAATGWRAILLASMSNMVFKAGVVALLGSRALLWRIGSMFGLALGCGGLLLWLWDRS